MQPLEWTPDDFVFVPEIDSDHRKLFRDADKVRQALANGAGASEVGFHVWRLSKSLTAHFAGEERAMRRSQYEALQWHQQQHRTGRARAALLQEAARQRDTQGTYAALEEFCHWLRDHVSLADRMFASHLRNDRRERLVS